MRASLAFVSIFATDNTLAASVRFRSSFAKLEEVALALEEHDIRMKKMNLWLDFSKDWWRPLFRGPLM